MVEMSTTMNLTELDVFVDNQPMNDEELSRLHESTLQMFRSNKIGPKNAFDIVLIDYLPAIFETPTFDDDRANNFQSVGTTLETSAKIYAARIDSLYSETRKAQSILRSNNENFQCSIDETTKDEENFPDQPTTLNKKKIRLMIKRKKTIVNDRQKLLRKNRSEEIRPIMLNQYFLSAMHNDALLLSELYGKIRRSKFESNEFSSSSVASNESISETLFVDTNLLSVSNVDQEISPSSSNGTTNLNLSNVSLTPNSQISSLTSLQSENSIRSRENSFNNDNTSILSNASCLLTEKNDEYAHLDSDKVNAFNNEKLNDESICSTKKSRKRRLSIEYPFPFLVEQAKKQRLTPKKVREEIFTEEKQNLFRAPSPEYKFTEDETKLNLSESTISIFSNNVNKRQRSIDFRHLQKDLQKTLTKSFENDQEISFSNLLDRMTIDEDQRTISSSDVSLYFAALLNNAVRDQLDVKNNEQRDDLKISSTKKI